MNSEDMSRISRLSAMLIQLQSKRIVSAREMAARFGVSVRTVYRDVRALEAAGVPIGSEPGKGYVLMEGYRLPPVIFSLDEVAALVTAGKFMDKMADDSLRDRYILALEKVLSVMSCREKASLEAINDHIAVFVDKQPGSSAPARFLSGIQTAIGTGRVLVISYHGPDMEASSARAVEPLGLFYYGGQWYLHAWCRNRRAYRTFRADRIKSLLVTEEAFDTGTHHSALRKVMETLGSANAPKASKPGSAPKDARPPELRCR